MDNDDTESFCVPQNVDISQNDANSQHDHWARDPFLRNQTAMGQQQQRSSLKGIRTSKLLQSYDKESVS